ncbi:MAG: 4Fe-4S binding protein [Fusobacteria bacterium]|nr:4Fe-4S binding protein [Fusobacteriota bacterium]
MKKQTFFTWSWILFIVFFILSIYDIRFALLGFICMMSPIVFSLSGYGKKNCSSICPRGSFLQNIMEKISLNNNMPKFLLKKSFKNLVLFVMFLVFSIAVVRSKGDPVLIGFALFRMIAVTSIIAFVLGVLYKPRTWCAICPMGHLSGEIAKKKGVKK